ncbi:helix-turn-helix domain-containing protein [Caldovatus aquaticus]|uniref:Helix-turn-helix domain-containing protein n=1 Tax=Caldovatus aquaticus TaxID=2865671 RepID=A0ABS7F1L3_9PROT|nr:helix-turn-helix domain-containing protein [Caldovatus aquaticus]MBW8269393.1 helix-turn-helix domain-containing protein [Caldovatus aquaticus]
MQARQAQATPANRLPDGARAAIGNGLRTTPTTRPADGQAPQDGLDLLDQFGTRRAVRRGHEFYAAGDPARFCYRIVSGCVRTVGLDEDGRRQIAEFLLPGDLFGFDALDTHHLTAEALTDTVVVCYPRRAVEALAEQNGALARRLRDLTLRSLRRAHEKMFLLGRKSAGERVAAFLLEMARRGAAQDGQGPVALPMTRADMADHLGLTIETVSRTMARLCRTGAIAPTRCGIEIRDPAALARFGAVTRH